MSNEKEVYLRDDFFDVNNLYYTEKEIRAIRRKRKWRKFKHKMINLGLFLLMLMSVAAFCLLTYVLATISSKTVYNHQVVTVGTMTMDQFDPVRTTMFGYDVTKYGDLSDVIIDFNTVGDYVIEYRPFLERRVRNIEIHVVDDVAPVIELNGDAIIYVPNFDEYVEPGFVANDNYDGNLTDNVVVEIDSWKLKERHIKYTVQDASGNEAKAERVVVVEDLTTVYLTFDDGPDPIVTPQILDTLNKYGVPATFFVLGLDSTEKEDLVKAEVAAGHTVGLHGYSHEYSEIFTSVDVLMNNFYILEDQIKGITNGYDSRVIRFPGGSSNTVSQNYCSGVMTAATKRAVDEGYNYFDWNGDSEDSGRALSDSAQIYRNVIVSIKPHKSNVILLHDGPGHQATADALELIIKFCIDHEYNLRAIVYETNPVRHDTQN